MIQIRVLKDGRPVKGVSVSYSKSGLFGGWGKKDTCSQGYASFDVDPGMAERLEIRGQGILYSVKDYYLQKGLNEFRFGCLFNPKQTPALLLGGYSAGFFIDIEMPFKAFLVRKSEPFRFESNIK